MGVISIYHICIDLLVPGYTEGWSGGPGSQVD